MNLRLLRPPSGAWFLVAVPDAQCLEKERRGARVTREGLAEPPALFRLRPAAAEVAA